MSDESSPVLALDPYAQGPVRRVLGKKLEVMTQEALLSHLSTGHDVRVDLGTGDGRYVLRQAIAHPDSQWLGIDAAVDAMRETASKALRKPAKGGAANAWFLVAEAEKLPACLVARVQVLSVQYPWGSLLRAMVEEDVTVLRGMVGLLVPGGQLDVWLNATVLEDPAYCERLSLTPLDQARFDQVLRPAWERLGLEVLSYERFEGDDAVETSWGRRLTRGSQRASIRIEARRREP